MFTEVTCDMFNSSAISAYVFVAAEMFHEDWLKYSEVDKRINRQTAWLLLKTIFLNKEARL
jgi:hypothetical protein